MNLRSDIFRRTAALLGGIIILCWLAMSVFAVVHNREGWLNFVRNDAVFLAEQSEKPLLWDDRVALRELFVSRKNLNAMIDDIYVESGGAAIAHTFSSGTPTGLVGINPPGAGDVSEVELRDAKGRVFYCIAARVGDTGASVHILVSRGNVDREAVGPVVAVTAICVAGWLLSLIPAGYVARELTREVAETTQALESLNEELEARVMERTAQLSSAVESLNAEVAERVRMEKEKEDFHAMVTHDMKSPLSVILGYTDLMLEDMPGRLDDDTVEIVSGIRRSGGKLLRMVEDFLSVSRIESGRLQATSVPDTLPNALDDTITEFVALARNKGLEFKAELQDGLPVFAFDRKLLQRAVANLLQNAVNYTPTGGTVTIAAISAEDGRSVVISVKDTGPGIPADELDKVFEKYYRSAGTASVRGSGLGLTIVKAVADAHCGRVELVSDFGSGSEFRIFLPVAS